MKTYENRPDAFRSVSPDEWSDWRWQQRHQLNTPREFDGVLELTDRERRGFERTEGDFRVGVTPYYASLMDPTDPDCPVRRQALPDPDEARPAEFERRDPLAEEEHMPVAGITHRYPDRVLFYVTHHCPVFCRHCTRKRKVSDPKTAASKGQIERGLDYIRDNADVRDVLVSGGDPLTLSDERLMAILGALRDIDHVEVIRLGTRNPVTLPYRVTESLCSRLEEVGPIYVNTHFNHPKELTSEAESALRRLVSAGCVLGNQMVLLRQMNDDPQTVMRLNRQLLAVGCRPYYMLQCDMAEGITHFRTSLRRGLEIMDHLRGRIAGMGIPDFVVDLPGGGGKVELVPQYLQGRESGESFDEVRFRNWRGETYSFADLREACS
jgi:lysine 2,3-aminomutase